MAASMKPRFRWIKAALLATTILGAPGLAYADPISLTAIAATAAQAGLAGAIGGTLGAVLGAVAAAAISFAGQALFANPPSARQRKSRTRQFDPHPNFRFAFGEFPQEGSVVFHHVDGQLYYLAYLLSSIPCDEITRIEINDGLHLPLQNPETLKVMNDPTIDYKGGSDVDDSFNDFKNGRIVFWFGDGTQTQPPQLWLDRIGDVLEDTDIWKGAAVMFVQIDHSSDPRLAAKLFPTGKPPLLKFFGKWSRLYDPRKDSNSGVTGASGTHDPDDYTTWEFSRNPALAGLMLAFHDKALGFDREMIPIQQWATAADDCRECRDRLADAALYIALDVSGSMDGAKIEAQATAVANLLREIKDLADATKPNDVRIVLYNSGVADSIERRDADDGDYDALIAFAEGATTASGGTDFNAGVQSASTFYDGAGSKERLLVFTTDGVPEPASTADDAKATLDAISDLARHAFNIELEDTTQTEKIDNTGGVPVVPAGDPDLLAKSFLGAVGLNGIETFCCDGMVEIESRDLNLLDPVLASFAAHLDTTGGMLGIRAGVWKAPTETLTEPVGDDIEIKGARDAGFDMVRAKFIAAHREWEPTDGPGFRLRQGARIEPLELELVANAEQAQRLEKIAALRAEPNRIISATWDGREAHRRLGERVSFALPGFARAASTFVIDAKQVITQEADDGFRVEVPMTLREDLESTYAFTADDLTDPDTFTSPELTHPEMDPPSSVTVEQSDYRSAAGATARLKITVTITQDVSERAGNLRVEVSDGGGFDHLVDILVSPGTLSYVAFLKPAEVGITYTARARAESEFIGVSSWVTSSSLTVVAPVLDYDGADYSAEYA